MGRDQDDKRRNANLRASRLNARLLRRHRMRSQAQVGPVIFDVKADRRRD
jgi:hypothetical protein